jgi:hypothetical protein
MRIDADGDCLFNAVARGSWAQNEYRPLGATTGVELRAASAQAARTNTAWLNNEFFTQALSPAELLVADLRQDQVTALAATYPALGAATGPGSAPVADPRTNLVARLNQARGSDLVDILTAIEAAYDHGGAANLTRFYRQVARRNNRLPAMVELITEALAETALWNSPAGDLVPIVLANVSQVTLVIMDHGRWWFINEGQPIRIILRRDGNHYNTYGHGPAIPARSR